MLIEKPAESACGDDMLNRPGLLYHLLDQPFDKAVVSKHDSGLHGRYGAVSYNLLWPGKFNLRKLCGIADERLERDDRSRRNDASVITAVLVDIIERSCSAKVDNQRRCSKKRYRGN